MWVLLQTEMYVCIYVHYLRVSMCVCTFIYVCMCFSMLGGNYHFPKLSYLFIWFPFIHLFFGRGGAGQSGR